MDKSESHRVKSEKDDSTVISMARVPLKSNFSINAILPDLANRTPTELSPMPSTASDAESSDGDVNVDYESDVEGRLTIRFFF